MSPKISEQAAEFGFVPITLSGANFQMEAYFKPGRSPGGQSLHVYLEGDGLPWLTPTIVSSDPTPRHPLMLKLMALDTAPSLYLGRPCYDGHSKDEPCSPSLWTDGRYSAPVLAAMQIGLGAFLADHPSPGIVFLGHSGGGALALLLANRFKETGAVITIAGNLDIGVWTSLHGFTPLNASINPADSPKTAHFRERHYLGRDDPQIPASVFEPIARRRPDAEATVLEGFDHSCCWHSIWPHVLGRLEQP